MTDRSRVRATIWLNISPRMVELGLAELARLRADGGFDAEVVHRVFGVMRDRQIKEEVARDLQELGYSPEMAEATVADAEHCGRTPEWPRVSIDHKDWRGLSAKSPSNKILTVKEAIGDFCESYHAKVKHPGRAKGGFAAAAKLTPGERSERGRRGAEARWGKK